MLLVLALAVGLWGAGWMLGTSRRARLISVAGLFVLIFILQLVLPAGHPLREITGGSAAPWLLFGGFAAIALGYGRLLARLRQRARPQTKAEPVSTGKFSATELDRYARHIVLRELGGPG
ncbi:MAG: molybdopterin biosynthesis protein, partial [Pseudomonadota bacterium]